MAEANLLDLHIDEQGEISVGYNGDILVARDEDVVAQEIMWRVKTTRGDWILVPECGADLELLVGLPNTPETGAMAESQVSRALTQDGFLIGELAQVRASPVNMEQIVVGITVEYGDHTFFQQFTLDLKEGVLG
jgi:hypothetical protein